MTALLSATLMTRMFEHAAPVVCPRSTGRTVTGDVAAASWIPHERGETFSPAPGGSEVSDSRDATANGGAGVRGRLS